MTEVEPTGAAAETADEQNKTSSVKENGKEKPSLGPVTEVEQGVKADKPATVEAPEVAQPQEEGAEVEKPPADDGATVESNKAADGPAAASNGDASVEAAATSAVTDDAEVKEDAHPAVPPPAADDAASVATEPAAAIEVEPVAAPTEAAPDAPPAPVDRTAVDAAEPKPEAAEPKADEQLQEPEAAPTTQPEAEPEQQEQKETQVEDKQDATPPAEAGEALPTKDSAKGFAEETKSDAPASVSEDDKADAASNPAEPLANGAANAADARVAGTANDASLVTAPGTVQALTRRLSSNSLQGQSQPATPPRSVSGDKGQPQTPTAVAAVSAPLPLHGKASKSPSAPRSGDASPPSSHDTKNTINVSQLLKLGAFKMQPLKDFVPYAELLRLRVEDGIDATRKEDYLNDEDFKQVFGMDRDSFKKQPAWRQVQAKKKANLF